MSSPIDHVLRETLHETFDEARQRMLANPCHNGECRYSQVMRMTHEQAVEALMCAEEELEMLRAERAAWRGEDRMAKMEAVVTAAREALRQGEHEGSCTNVDEDGEYLWDTCDLHLTAARRRETALIAALSVLDGRDG
jgi:hypothetical protein